MVVQESALYREIQAVFSAKIKPVTFYWECQIRAGGNTVNAYRVMSYDIQRNYVKRFSDVAHLTVTVPPGNFNTLIHPFDDNIEITLIRRTLGAIGGEADPDANQHTQVYRGVLLSKGSEVVAGNSPIASEVKTQNDLQIKEVTFQLMDMAAEQLRLKSIGGTFRNSTGVNVVRALLGLASEELKLDSSVRVRGVDVAPNFVEAKRNHIVIPKQMKVINIPHYVHEKCGGLYATGFAHYLQGGIWYLFSPYDLKRYTQAKRTLTVVNIPNNKLPGIEQTYRQTGNQTFIIANGQTQHRDDSEQDYLNNGNGVRFLDASKVMNGFVEVEGNRAVASRSESSVDMVFEKRENKLNFVNLSDEAVTSNIPFEKSKIAIRAGSFIETEWGNARDDIIFPGMPVKYIYEVNEKIMELQGCVIGAKYFSDLDGAMGTTTKHKCQATLTLFVEKDFKVK